MIAVDRQSQDGRGAVTVSQPQLTASDASDLIWVCRQLSAALQGDRSLVTALDSLSVDASPRAREFLQAMRQALAAGERMGPALTRLGAPAFASGLVWAGEVGARLGSCLTRLADQLEMERQLPPPRDGLLFAYGLAFSRLAALLKERVPILNALDLSGESSGVPQVQQTCYELHRAMAEGLLLGAALSLATEDLPATALEMIGDGEAAGHLDETLTIVADYLFDEAGQKEA
jgi:type II secretory pathway component PulF